MHCRRGVTCFVHVHSLCMLLCTVYIYVIHVHHVTFMSTSCNFYYISFQSEYIAAESKMAETPLGPGDVAQVGS